MMRFSSRKRGARRAVAVRLADVAVGILTRGQFVGLVEDHEIIGLHVCLGQAGEHAVSSEGIDADDDQVGVRANEGVPDEGIRTPEDGGRETKQGDEGHLIADGRGKG